MLITIRPELHERWTYDKIPASDYQIEADELAKIGAATKWRSTDGQLMQLPPATYITETATVANCRVALNNVATLTGRRVSAVIHEGENIYFHNLKRAAVSVPAPSISTLASLMASAPFETATPSVLASLISSTPFGTTKPSLFDSILGPEKKSEPVSTWLDAITGTGTYGKK